MNRRRRRRSTFDPGRFLAGCCASFGALALVLSFFNPITGASAPGEPFFVEVPAELEGEAQAAVFRPAATGDAAESRGVAAPAPTPLPPQPAPVDALPASRVRSVGVNNGIQRAANTASDRPLSVALVSLTADSSVADAVAAQLTGVGREVYRATLEGAQRPDVLLLFGESAGGVQVWYCDPGPASSAELARLLRSSLATTGEVVSSSTDVSCADVHNGRAQTAAVLLEAPAGAATGDFAAAVTAVVDRYLGTNGAALRSARSRTTLSWPASGPITSHYGPSHPLGIDVGQWDGPIRAAADGRVVFAGGDPCCSYGLYVVIESAGGVHTLYAHLARLEVKEGQTVRRGQTLGPVGCTGHCSGPHLHFEVFVNGVRVNPMLYLP